MIVVLEARYDNSDIQTDYFGYRTLFERYICDLEGKKVTEKKLRKALRLLSAYYQRLSWKYIKPEKYTLSPHYYGSLEAISNLEIINDWGYNARIYFVITATYFQPDPLPIPKDEAEIKRLIEQHYKEERERAKRTKEAMKKIYPKIIRDATAIIDAKGFRILTEKEKEELIRKYIA